MIKIEHLKKEYAGVTPLKDVSTEIHDGDVIAVIGPSGTGKSTLLRCINQLEKPTSGRIWVDGTEITVLQSPEQAYFYTYLDDSYLCGHINGALSESEVDAVLDSVCWSSIGK